jgi:hypothetical protein
VKVTGNIPSAGSMDVMVSDANLNVTVNRGYDVVQAIYRNQNKMIYNTDHTMTQNIKFSQLATLGNITANKIVSGNTIFGVVGTGGGSGGSGDIKLFETIAAMQADSSAEEGDLALVYTKGYADYDGVSSFNKVKIFKNVTLPELSPDYSKMQQFRDLTEASMDIMMVGISPDYMNVNYYTDAGYGDFTYTSTDGIHYVCDAMTTDYVVVEFNTELTYDPNGGGGGTPESYDTVANNFFKVFSSDYQGLFEYREDTDISKTRGLDLALTTADIVNNNAVLNESPYIVNLSQNKLMKIASEVANTHPTLENYSIAGTLFYDATLDKIKLYTITEQKRRTDLCSTIYLLC